MYSPLPDSPRLALCIATVGRITELDRLLTSLEQQICTDFHIYLADQNAPDTLTQAVEAFRRHPEAGAVLGYWTPSPQFPQPDNTEQALSATALFSQGGTCVQFFRAEVVKDLRFDPRLGPGTGLPYGCGEDTDYLLEAHKRAPVWRCPSIRVFHPSPDTHVPSDAKIASYAAGRMYLLKKHAFPLWFRCANVLYPLCMLPLDALRKGRKAARYRWRMFVERLRHFSS